MILTGTLVNSAAIIAGSVAGVLLGRFIPRHLSSAVEEGVALCVLYIGVDGMLAGENTLVAILSALGTGNKTDPTLLRIDDISKTYNCSLARVMRKELRARGVKHLRVLFSPELPAATEQKEAPPPGRRSVPASLTWVPGCGGLMMGGEAVLDLVRRAKEEVK